NCRGCFEKRTRLCADQRDDGTRKCPTRVSGRSTPAQEGDVEAVTVQGVPEFEQAQHYQCLECGSLLVNSEELLQHQEMHMRDAGMEVEQQGTCPAEAAATSEETSVTFQGRGVASALLPPVIAALRPPPCTFRSSRLKLWPTTRAPPVSSAPGCLPRTRAPKHRWGSWKTAFRTWS
ncbi:unnamed protein product, partial [Tetraodon nigroviridis]